ncbi:MAG: choice-of-anchor Q domain-containing protein [Actinomycetota bacterium]
MNCDTAGNLQAKIQTAPAGGTILVKGTCVGNFLIVGKGLTIKGNPTATLDGGDLFRPLGINSPGKVVHLVGLTVTGGVAQFGAGILDQAGGLTLDWVTVRDNLATSSSAPATGGGILSGGNLTLTDSTVSGNRARTTDSGGEADGGGIAVVNGDLTVTNSTIAGNRATAALSTGSAIARGGGFYVESGHFTLHGARVSGNRVTASQGVHADAQGGGGSNETAVVDSVVGSIVTGNAATAESGGGFAGAAGSGLSGFDTLHVTGSTISGNVVSATGSTATAGGGGLSPGVVNLMRSTVNGNRVTARSTGGDAIVSGGGVSVEGMEATASTISRNVATAATSGAFSALSDGGGIDSDSPIGVTNSTIALNRLTATSPVGGSSVAQGGGIRVGSGPSTLVDSTVAGNIVTTTGGGSASKQGGGLYTGSGLTLEATIVATNAATQGPDCFGGPTSNGHNLIRKTVGCTFTKTPTDIVAKDPKLGALANNGGPTQTMAIGLTSPARDAIPNAACAVAIDQRGVHRPQGPKCDIGAYERKIA